MVDKSQNGINRRDLIETSMATVGACRQQPASRCAFSDVRRAEPCPLLPTPPTWRATMLRNLSIAAISVLLFACSGQAEPDASIGVGNPYPVSDYTCQDGTRLAVRLLGERASVSVNGSPAVDLPALGTDGTTFSNGQWTLAIVQGQTSWGVGRAVPSPCTGG